MTTKKREEDLEAMSLEIARMREDIASLSESIKSRAASRAFSAPGEGEMGVFAEGEEGHKWEDIRASLDEARARGEKAIKDLTDEVQRHPLGSIAAAVGIGFILARLFGGRGRN